MKPTTVEISSRSIVRTIVIILLFAAAWHIRSILLLFLAAFVLMTGFAYIADWFTARGLSKTASALVAYSFLLGFLALLLFLIVPPLLVQIREFVDNFPFYVAKLQEIYDGRVIPQVDNSSIANILAERVGSSIDDVISVLLNTVSGVLNFFTIAVLSFYLLIERDKIKNNIFVLFPHLPKERVTKVAHKIEEKVGAWVRGELILMFVVGTLTYIGLTLLRVEYALPLAIIAGLLEIVPVIGPVISSVPAILVALVTNPISAIGVVLLYIIVQQLENNILVPEIMKAAAGLSPLVVILGLLAGGSLFGVVGAILAVPTLAIGQVIVSDMVEHRSKS
jgi:predicted PurR-regulated permease PerM